PGAAEALGVNGGRRSLGRLADMDQQFMLVDHMIEFEADAVARGPGDAGRDDRLAAHENDLAADVGNLGAFDQGALARQVAKARLDLAERGLKLGREQYARPLGRAIAG